MAVDTHFELYALLPEKRLALCIVPKVASMSIIQAISDMYGAKVKTPSHKNSVFRWFTPGQVKELIPDWQTAIFVRHPEERIKSCYRYHILQGGISRSANLRKKFPSKKIDFDGFISKVIDNPHYDAHYFPQSDMGDRFDFVGKHESISADWAQFRTRFDIALPDLPHINKSTTKTELVIPNVELFRRVYAKDYEMFGYE